MAPLFQYRSRLFGFLGTGFLFGVGLLYVHEGFIVLFFGNVFVWSYLLRQVRCRHCGARLAPDIGASFIEVASSFQSTECKACGTRLDIR
jgi:ribosomal protein S27E